MLTVCEEHLFHFPLKIELNVGFALTGHFLCREGTGNIYNTAVSNKIILTLNILLLLLVIELYAIIRRIKCTWNNVAQSHRFDGIRVAFGNIGIQIKSMLPVLLYLIYRG